MRTTLRRRDLSRPRRTVSIARGAAVALALALGAQGCSAEGPVAAPAAPVASTPVAAAAAAAGPSAEGAAMLLGAMGAGDYEPVDSPRELAEQVDIVVDGEVTDIANGRSIGLVGDGPWRHFVVTIRPTKWLKAPRGGRPDLVHIEFRRPDNYPAQRYRDAIPLGTRVVLFGAEVDEKPQRHEWFNVVRNRWGGRPDRGALYVPHPQGLLLEVDGRVPYLGGEQRTDGWEGLDTCDEVVLALEV